MRMTKFMSVLVILFGVSAAGNTAGAYTFELVLRTDQLVRIARDALKEGRFEDAKVLYQRALKRSLSTKDRHWAHNDLCVAHYFLKEHQEGLVHCDAAIKIRSNDWTAFNNRGNILIALERYDAAKEAYLRGLELSPQSTILNMNLEIAERRAAEAVNSAGGNGQDTAQNNNKRYYESAPVTGG